MSGRPQAEARIILIIGTASIKALEGTSVHDWKEREKHLVRLMKMVVALDRFRNDQTKLCKNNTVMQTIFKQIYDEWKATFERFNVTMCTNDGNCLCANQCDVEKCGDDCEAHVHLKQ
jgi:predicted metal-binding protein